MRPPTRSLSNRNASKLGNIVGLDRAGVRDSLRQPGALNCNVLAKKRAVDMTSRRKSELRSCSPLSRSQSGFRQIGYPGSNSEQSEVGRSQAIDQLVRSGHIVRESGPPPPSSGSASMLD
jgi:hypothetical protein